MGKVKESDSLVEEGMGIWYDLDGAASTRVKFCLKPWCKPVLDFKSYEEELKHKMHFTFHAPLHCNG